MGVLRITLFAGMGFPSVVPFTGAYEKTSELRAVISLLFVGCGKKGAGRSYIPIAPTTPYDRGPNDLGGGERSHRSRDRTRSRR